MDTIALTQIIIVRLNHGRLMDFVTRSTTLHHVTMMSVTVVPPLACPLSKINATTLTASIQEFAGSVGAQTDIVIP
jgi:hypothetical protein